MPSHAGRLPGDRDRTLAAVWGGNNLRIPSGTASATSYDNGKKTSQAIADGQGGFITRQSGVSGSNYADIARDQSGVFQSIHDGSGRTLSVSELTPNSVVKLANGNECKLSAAIKAGWIRQASDGSYHDQNGRSTKGGMGVSPKSEAAAKVTQSGTGKEQDETLHPDLISEPFSEAHKDAEAALTELCNTTSPGAQISAINDIIKDGVISEQRLGQLATELGLEGPDAVSERISPVLSAYQEQADTLVESMGVEPEEFYEWAKTNRGPALQEAMRKHGLSRQTSGYKPLITEYVTNLAKHNEASILNADLGPGVSVRKDDKGQVIIKLPQGEFTFASAVRSGLIKLSRSKQA